MGNYNLVTPVTPADIQERKAYFVGGGIASLTGAFFLLRDARMPGENITILEELDVKGGSLDGSGDAETGYIMRGGREMETHYECFYDVLRDIPSLEMGPEHSVLDEFCLINDLDPNSSKCRLIRQQGTPQDFSHLNLNRAQQRQLTKLFLMSEEDTYGKSMEDHFTPDFFDTDFFTFWRTMFAFQTWHSLTEQKRYMHRFIQHMGGINDMSALKFSKYNQFDSFVKPIMKYLADHGVRTQYATTVLDLDLELTPQRRVVTGIRTLHEGREQVIPVAERDLVFVTLGSMTESSGYGDMHTPAPLRPEKQNGAFTLWRNLARKDEVFGHPDVFASHVDKSKWESFTLTCKPSALTEKIAQLAQRELLTGRTVTGGVITITDSNWLMSFTVNRQPQYPTQPKDIAVVWGYALFMHKPGNHIKKTMPECTGGEILDELLYHLGLLGQRDEIMAQTICRPVMMPYITLMFMPRTKGDRPEIIPPGCVNLGLLGQFVETKDDVVFTVESSVRTAMQAVYGLLNLNRPVPPVAPAQYDIRNILNAAHAMNNNKPLPGERLLERFLQSGYYADKFGGNAPEDR